jgi:hypothetical protein
MTNQFHAISSKAESMHLLKGRSNVGVVRSNKVQKYVPKYVGMQDKRSSSLGGVTTKAGKVICNEHEQTAKRVHQWEKEHNKVISLKGGYMEDEGKLISGSNAAKVVKEKYVEVDDLKVGDAKNVDDTHWKVGDANVDDTQVDDDDVKHDNVMHDVGKVDDVKVDEVRHDDAQKGEIISDTGEGKVASNTSVDFHHTGQEIVQVQNGAMTDQTPLGKVGSFVYENKIPAWKCSHSGKGRAWPKMSYYQSAKETVTQLRMRGSHAIAEYKAFHYVILHKETDQNMVFDPGENIQLILCFR